MSVQGEIYKSYEDAAQLYTSYNSPAGMPAMYNNGNQNLRQQQVQTFNAFHHDQLSGRASPAGSLSAPSPHVISGAQPRPGQIGQQQIAANGHARAGIGIRVESNSSGEFEVEHVHRNGAAERNGNVFVGDVIDTIDGRPVNGLKLMELGPLIRGPVGSSVTLGLFRQMAYTEKKQEVIVDLVRGSALYFLSQENERAAIKLGAMNTQLGEVELELNGLKNVLYQSESQVTRNQNELESLQAKYKHTQEEIEKMQQETAREEHSLLVARLSVPTEDSAARTRMRTLHESLSEAEVRLSKVMEELKEEQKQSWALEDEMAKEHSLTSHLTSKIELEQSEIEKISEHITTGMTAAESEKRKKNRELERELDELKMRDSFVPPDHLLPQKLAEDEANELVHQKRQLESASRDLQDKANEQQLVVVKTRTLENARDREMAVLKDRDETIERVQRQLDDGSRRAAADIAELRQAREDRNQKQNEMLSDLERRLQELKMEKISAENEVQMIQRELATIVPKRMRENEILREKVALKEQELQASLASLAEMDEIRAQMLENAALDTVECQQVCRNTENIDSEIIKCMQRQHAMDSFMAGTKADFDEADFEITQELIDARNDLVREHQILLAEKEEIVANQRGIEQLREINQNLALRSRDFEKMRARNLERLQDNIGLHHELGLRIDGVDMQNMFEEIQDSMRQSDVEVQHSIQALERYKRDYENRNESSLPPVDFSASATPRVEPSASHTEDLIQRMSATPGPQPDNGSDNERQLSPMSPLTDGTLWNASTGDEESRREEARRVAETELEEARRQSQGEREEAEEDRERLRLLYENEELADLLKMQQEEEEQRQEEKRREIESIEREIEMVERLKNAGRRSGAICVSVVWDNSVQESDLDILVDCPGGQINFKNRRVGNGVLDTDSRGDVAAVENVCWETPDVGVFKVHLKNFTAGYATPYTVILTSEHAVKLMDAEGHVMQEDFIGSKSFAGTVLHPANPTVFSFQVAKETGQILSANKEAQEEHSDETDLERMVREDLEQKQRTIDNEQEALEERLFVASPRAQEAYRALSGEASAEAPAGNGINEARLARPSEEAPRSNFGIENRKNRAQDLRAPPPPVGDAYSGQAEVEALEMPTSEDEYDDGAATPGVWAAQTSVENSPRSRDAD